MNKIWNDFAIGSIKLEHRLALAPMTRLRALPDGRPSDWRLNIISSVHL